VSLESFNVSQRLPAVWTDVYGVLTVVDAERNEAATQQSAPTDTPHIRHRLLQTTDRAYAGAVEFGNNNTFCYSATICYMSCVTNNIGRDAVKVWCYI